MTSLPIQQVTHASDWIGLEAEPTLTLGILYSQDEADNSSRTFYLSKQINEEATVNIEVGNEQLQHQQESFDSETLYTQLDWLFDNKSNLAISYQFQGKQSELEVEQLGLQLGYSPYPAFMSIELLTGDVSIFTRDNLPAQFNIPDNYQSDFTASSVHLGWWFDQFNLSVRHQLFDYQRDLSTLGSRARTPALIKPAALAQSGILLQDRTTISIDMPLNKRRLSGHLIQTKSAIDKQTTRSIQFDWSENLNKSIDLNLSINRSDEDQNTNSYSIGLEWRG